MTTRVVFMGTPDFAVPSLAALLSDGYQVVGVVTQPDRPAGRGRQLASSPVRRFAATHGLTVLQPTTLRQPEPVAELQALAPDLIVVAAYGLILPQSVLDIPPHGCLNVHGSLLPRYRGAAPIPAAILAGDRETGVTIMLMDADMDTGPILSQAACSIEPDDTTGTLTARLAELGAALLSQTLPRWLAGEIEPQPQDDERATYAPMVRKADGQIDWTLPAEQIARRVRAYQPWPGATTFWEGQPLKLLKVHAVQGTTVAPGRVVAWGEGAGVGTGEGLLLLEEVQLAGKRAMSIADFLRGRRGFLGSVLGSPSPPLKDQAQ
ncbi:MAG: methionyl-tRNA formyltransferase [Anaerolineae bacterium]|nr:methionyl-tRNA formyltransferase [Anaerolineae bacterium]